MTEEARKMLKSRPTRELSRRTKDFSSSPPLESQWGEAQDALGRWKGHRTNLYSATNGSFSEGTGKGREEGRPAGGTRSPSHQDTG